MRKQTIQCDGFGKIVTDIGTDIGIKKVQKETKTP